MSPRKEPRKPHVWLHSDDYARLTHTENVCYVCGQRKYNSDQKCPGRRPPAA